MNTELTYTEPWMQKRMWSHLTWFSQCRRWPSKDTWLELSGIFNLFGSIWDKRRQLLQMCAILQKIVDPGPRGFHPSHPSRGGLCKGKVVGCVCFGWASSWTRASTCHQGDFLLHQGHCSFKVSPAQVVNQLDLLSSWHGPSGRCPSNCSDMTQLQSPNGSQVSFPKKKVLRGQPVKTFWRKQAS